MHIDVNQKHCWLLSFPSIAALHLGAPTGILATSRRARVINSRNVMATKKLRAQLETLEAENSRLGDKIRNLTEAKSTKDDFRIDEESSTILETHRQALQAELLECQERNHELE